MPSSIDPVENMFGTGASLLGRILVAFSAGWLGNLVSRVCGSFTSWDHVKNPGDFFTDMFGDFGVEEVLGFVFWPLVVLYYLLKVPFYALVLTPILFTCLIRIIFTDDPILFWALCIVTALAPGLAFTDGTAWSLLPLAFALTGLGAALWWAVNVEHGHWVDSLRDWKDRMVEARRSSKE